MFSRSLLFAATAATLSSAVVAQDAAGSVESAVAGITSRNDDSPELIFQRDDGQCYSFGIDFQDGGSYFIDSQSNASFTAVSQFTGCQNDTSSILLVNDETGDQYECSSVSTVPDNTSQLSTCPIDKNQMTTGNWSILAIGNNGADGDPFAWQRDFYLSVGVPETTTVTPTVTYTQTSTPITTTTSTSVIETTSTVPNTQTITVPGLVKTKTITPKPETTTSKKIIARTFNRWTKTQEIITHSITPSCTVPARPHFPDPKCHIIPTVIPIPKGLKINAKRGDKPVPIEYARKRFENARAAKERAEREAEVEVEKRNLAVRAPDAPTVTVTADTAVNTTTTVYASTSTVTDVTLTTSTALITDPPATVKQGVLTQTITAPAVTKTITRIGYTVSYRTKTMSLTWTYTTTVTPTAHATACKKKGGHFGGLKL